MKSQPDVFPEQIGVTGFCLGGGLTSLTACKFSDEIAAAAPFYGMVLDEWIEAMSNITVPIYLFHGGVDPFIPPERTQQIESRFKALGKEYTLKVYPDADHVFFATSVLPIIAWHPKTHGMSLHNSSTKTCKSLSDNPLESVVKTVVGNMDSEIETQIRECELRLYTAMSASNVSELDVLIADDLLFVGPTGELATKAMDLDLHRTGGTHFHEFVPKELEIRVWSEHFVLTSAHIFLSGTYLGNAFAGNYRYMRVWRRGKSGWQIVGGSVTAIV